MYIQRAHVLLIAMIRRGQNKRTVFRVTVPIPAMQSSQNSAAVSMEVSEPDGCPPYSNVFYYTLESSMKLRDKSSSGAVQPTCTESSHCVQEIAFPFPPLAEQRRISR